MTGQPTDPSERREDLQEEPNALARARAFMEERRIAGIDQANPGEPILASHEDLATRSSRIRQYRNLQGQHNPQFPGVGSGGNGSNARGAQVQVGLQIDSGIDSGLLPGHFYPIGPSALLDGQANTDPTVSGRVTALAISNDGQRIYAGAANGGIWRSDNAGMSWRPMMNAIHFAPTTLQADSLAIGAVAIDPNQPDLVFAGTGEGPGRVSIGGSQEFFGVGPISSQDGGYSWQTETVDDEQLVGSAFFRMIIDPDDTQKVTAASRHGVMQRRPRNYRLDLAYKPQVYFFRNSIQSGDLGTAYLDEGGETITNAWDGGGGYLETDDRLYPFVYNGWPYFVQYNFKNGDANLDFWDVNGEPARTLRTSDYPEDWGKNITSLFPVTLMGYPCMVTYKSGTGRATLRRFDIMPIFWYQTETVWENRDWGTGWTNFIPIEITGVPHFLAYNLVNGAATLQRWLPNGDYVRVWRETWPLRMRMMAFNIRENSYLLRVSSQTGDGRLLQWNEDGSYESIRDFPIRTFTQSLNLQLVPFQFENQSRFVTYDLNSGAFNLYQWGGEMALELLESRRWDTHLFVGTFNMGYEWVFPKFDPEPPTAPSLPDPDTPTASGLTLAKSAGVTHYFAAFWDDKVYRSVDGGLNWSLLGTGFPSQAGRITLAAQRNNLDVLYAFLEEGHIYRWDSSDNKWRDIQGVPPKDELVGKQGGYDLAITVAPNDVDTIFIGGSGFSGAAALYRCKVSYNRGTVYNNITMVPTWIGNSVHADVHALEFTECMTDHLWVGCDGGVFATQRAWETDALAIETLFRARNCGLGTQTVNYMEQHPDEDAIVYCGTQDNGGQLFTGCLAWQLASYGDCGHVLLDWSDSQNILFTYIYNEYSNSTNAGQTPKTNAGNTIPNVERADSLFYPPFAGTPAQVGTSPDSRRIAYASNRPWLNEDFGVDGSNWVAMITQPFGDGKAFRAKSMVFFTPGRLVAGLLNGQIYRLDENTAVNPARWDVTRLDTIGAGLGVSGPITAIAPDPEDATHTSFYVTIGGSVKDYRRVWYFDGTDWQARSGPGKDDVNALIDVQFNAITAVAIGTDTHVFAGADIGLWHSPDGGQNWEPFSVGIPESAIFDLKVFPEDQTQDRPWLLRAATYGRSIFERVLDGGSDELKASLLEPVQLFIRTNYLDRGLYPSSTRTVQGFTLSGDIRLSVDMKIFKSSDGNFRKPDGRTILPSNIDFCEFQRLLSQNFNAGTVQAGRMYVCVQTRGTATVDNVKVRLLMAKVDDTAQPINDASPMPLLPANLRTAVQNDSAITPNSGWEDLGTTTVNGLFAASPLVTSANFQLIDQGSYFVIAILDQAQDRFNDPQRNALTLITNNRKTALTYFIVDF